MPARMKNPAVVIPEAMTAIRCLNQAVTHSGVPQTTLELVHLRVSQINGCAVCLGAGVTALEAGESAQRLLTLTAWRETPYFTDAERAALALAEAVTRLADRTDPVPDHVWEQAAAHYDEPALAGLLLWIAQSNVFNRLNIATRQVPEQWAGNGPAQAPHG